MKIWDTAGAEQFQAITYSFYRRADTIVIAFDITDNKTFTNVKKWLEAIEQNAPKEVPNVRIWTKMDLEADRQVKKADAEHYA